MSLTAACNSGGKFGRIFTKLALMFVIFETKEIGDQLFSEMSEWRKQYDFKITDTIVFDGDVIDQLRKK